MLGVHYFRFLVPHGDGINWLVRRSQPGYRVVRDRLTLADYEARTRRAEAFHLGCLLVMAPAAMYATFAGWSGNGPVADAAQHPPPLSILCCCSDTRARGWPGRWPGCELPGMRPGRSVSGIPVDRASILFCRLHHPEDVVLRPVRADSRQRTGLGRARYEACDSFEFCVLLLLLIPAVAHAQASIAGTVRDTSGGALPGVTVEASSPALIEKVRTATSDDSGLYRIVNLPPASAPSRSRCQGFNQVKREGIELTGSFTAQIDAEMARGRRRRRRSR